MVSLSDARKLLESNPVALATLGPRGDPHCIVVGFVKAVSKDEVLITDNYMVETKKNLLHDPRVALSVWDNKGWDTSCAGSGFELLGTARYFSSGEWLDRAKRIPENKGEPCKGAVLVKITAVRKL